MARKGPLTKNEVDFVLRNAARMTPDDIARRLGRSRESVLKVIQTKYDADAQDKPLVDLKVEEQKAEETVIRQELKESQAWRMLKQEFTTEELKYFQELYLAIMGQFQGDVLPTEETQVFDAVKIRILISRNLVARRASVEDVRRLEAEIEAFPDADEDAPRDDATRRQKIDLENLLQAARQAEQARTTEFVKLQERYDSILKQLKSTRDQRVKDIESARVSFVGLIKMLAQQDKQAYEGRQMELAKLAAEKEYKRLGQLHTYADGTADNPILSADTVDLDR